MPASALRWNVECGVNCWIAVWREAFAARRDDQAATALAQLASDAATEKSALRMPAAKAAATKSRPHYTPGQNAPVTGLYRVHHGATHREDHDVVIIRGEEFPACRLCKGQVTYTIKQQASHITHDIDFTAPTALILTRTRSSEPPVK